MISAMNFKPFDKGSMRGFFDLRYHGMTVKSCRLMTGSNGLWVALPSNKVERDGETKYVDIVELTKSEMDHVRRLVIADLEAQGHIQNQNGSSAKPKATKPTSNKPTFVTPDGEDLSQYCSQPGEDISF